MKSLLIVTGLKLILSGSVYAGPYYEPTEQVIDFRRVIQSEDHLFTSFETHNQAFVDSENLEEVARGGTSLTAEKIQLVTRLYYGIMDSDLIFKQFNSIRQARYMYDNFQYHQFNQDMAMEDIHQIILVIKNHQNKRK